MSEYMPGKHVRIDMHRCAICTGGMPKLCQIFVWVRITRRQYNFYVFVHVHVLTWTFTWRFDPFCWGCIFYKLGIVHHRFPRWPRERMDMEIMGVTLEDPMAFSRNKLPGLVNVYSSLLNMAIDIVDLAIKSQGYFAIVMWTFTRGYPALMVNSQVMIQSVMEPTTWHVCVCVTNCSILIYECITWFEI